MSPAGLDCNPRRCIPRRCIPRRRLAAIGPAIGIALLLPGWPGWATAACPAHLPESIYATRCTGGEVTLREIGAAVVYRDCPKGARPARPMAREILALIEKVRCMAEGRVIAEGRVTAEGGDAAGGGVIAEGRVTAEGGDAAGGGVIAEGRVVVTSGYRSSIHNLYSWAVLAARHAARKGAVGNTEAANPVSRKSKHMQGKAVDFYLRGYSFAQHQGLLARLRRWAGRLPRALRGSREVIWARAYKAGEARDPDNRHPYPYIHVELRR